MSQSAPVRMSDSIAAISTAMIEFHKQCPKIPKQSKNPFLKTKYADLSTILEIIQPILNECGLLVQQHPTANFGLTTIISHSSGEWISSEYPMQPIEAVVEKATGDRPASKSITPQSIGTVITYQRRYALSAILALNIDDDNDGHVEPTTPAAPATPRKTPQELMAEAAAKVEATRDGANGTGSVAVHPVSTTPADAPAVPFLNGETKKPSELASAESVAKINQLCSQLGIDDNGKKSICQKRGVFAFNQLSQEQAITIITNLAAMAANAVASGGASESGVTVGNDNDPCTDQQVGEIKAALAEWEQSQPGVVADFIARLNGAGFGFISDMTFKQASELKAAIEAKAISSFFGSILETAAAG